MYVNSLHIFNSLHIIFNGSCRIALFAGGLIHNKADLHNSLVWHSFHEDFFWS